MMKRNCYKPSEAKTMQQRRHEMLHFVVGGKETPAEKQARLARVRKTMTKKAYMEYLARERSTVGSDCRAAVFAVPSKDPKHLRRQAKVDCRKGVW